MKFIALLLIFLFGAFLISWGTEREKNDIARRVADELEKRQKNNEEK